MKHKLFVWFLVPVLLLCLAGCEKPDASDNAVASVPAPTEETVQSSMDNDALQEDETVADETEATRAPNTPDRLIVNGQDITEGNHVSINYKARNAEIPVLAIFRALGHEAEMHYNGEGVYHALIDQSTILLNTRYADYGLDSGYSSKSAVRKMTEDDFIVDVDSIYTLLYWAWNIDIRIDYSAGIVYVDSFDPYAYVKHSMQLIVNGKDITEGNETNLLEYHSSNELELPFLAILKELGAKISWKGSTITIRYRGEKSVLDLEAEDFGLMPAPGGICIRRATDSEVYMEWYTVRTFLKYFMEADIRTDYEQHIVYVDFVDNA